MKTKRELGEKFMGEKFKGVNNDGIPNIWAAPFLDNVYNINYYLNYCLNRNKKWNLRVA